MLPNVNEESKYLAAEAVDLYIGDIQFDAIRVIQTGEYRLSGRQILTAVGEPDNWFSRLRKKGGVSLKTLEVMDLSILRNQGVWVEYYANQNVTRAESRSLAEADACWEYFDANGNRQAKLILRALRQDSLRDRFDQKYGKGRATEEERRERDNRILDVPSAWKRMYEPEFCSKAFSFFGAKFYWDFCYGWMSPEEICKVNTLNPVKSGKRAKKIHQYLTEEIRDRLTPYVTEMVVIMDIATSPQEFRSLYARRYGATQISLDF